MNNMNHQTQKFFLYARKSTDEPERQVLSIEAQLFELKEHDKKEKFLTPSSLLVNSNFYKTKQAHKFQK